MADLRKNESPASSDKAVEHTLADEKAGPAFVPDLEETADIDQELDRRITRKLDLHILPWLWGIWLFAFIDRSNIGNARIDGLVEDLNLTGTKFNVALAVFYIPYILVDVPSNWILKRVGAGFYIPLLITLWGIVGACIGLTKSYGGLIAGRLLLGLFEGGLFGGMVLYISMFYRRHQILLRIALWYCAAPISGAVGGLLAAGLSRIQHGGYNRWPWIFIVEGVITVAFGLVTFFFLPHTPGTAKFLSEEEKQAAVKRLQLDSHGSNATEAVDFEKFDWRWVKMAVYNWNTWLLCLNFLLILVPIYSYSLFLPTIIQGLGYRDVQAQLLTVPPNVLGAISVLCCAFASDRLKMRGPFIIGGCFLGIIGYIMLIATDRPKVQYGGTFLVAAGIFQMSPAVCAWLSNNLAPHYVRATGTGLQVSIANCAAFIATFTYLQKDRPRYIAGHAINLGALVLTIILTSTIMLYCHTENKKRARGARDGRLAEGEALLGYRHPSFRYTL